MKNHTPTARRLTIRPRAPFAVVFALALVALQAIAPTPPAMAGLVLIVGIHLLAYAWVRVAAIGLQVERARFEGPIFVGDPIAERLTVRSRSWLPLLWGELRDYNAVPGYAGRALVALPPQGSATVPLTGTAGRRGVYALGPIVLAMGDPFGLFEARLQVAAGARRVVYPRPQEVSLNLDPRGILPVEGLPGPDPYDRSLHAITVRPYAPGDAPHRIHWRTTARRSYPGRDALFVKEFEPQSSGNLWLALDLEAAVQYGIGTEGSEERAVVLGASLAERLLRAGRAVGFLAFGAAARLALPRPGPAQRWSLLEELAAARAQGVVPLDVALDRLSRAARRGDAVAVITPRADEDWLDGVRALLWRGLHVDVILLSEPHGEHGASLAAHLRDLGVPTHIVAETAVPAGRAVA